LGLGAMMGEEEVMVFAQFGTFGLRILGGRGSLLRLMLGVL
jgi:hypothetical protein